MMDTDAIYSAVLDYGAAKRARFSSDEELDHRDRVKRLLNESDEEHKSLLAENERLVDEVNEARKETSEQARLNGMGSEREARLMAEVAELKAKLTDKASLLRGCYAADHKQKQRIEELAAERDALKAELEAEREESKRWLVKAQNERDARKELEAELKRIKALEPTHWQVTQGARSFVITAAEFNMSTFDYGSFVALYALGRKTA